MNIGFSTGSLAKGDFQQALAMLKNSSANVIELSALRENELNFLIESFDKLELSQFKYISFHAPSKLSSFSEDDLIHELLKIKEKSLYIIVHPDIIKDFSKWNVLGKYLCIENMDKRKSIGCTTYDLERIFNLLPEASFCLDLAHARQVDSTMSEAFMMINKFKNKLVQIHLSDVNSNSYHEPLNFEAILSYLKVTPFIDSNLPVVLESPVNQLNINNEINLACNLFKSDHLRSYLSKFIDKLNTVRNAESNYYVSDFLKLGIN